MTSYTYNANSGTTATSSLSDSNGNLIVSLNYGYNGSNLISLTRAAKRNGNNISQAFTFAYDGWNHLTSAKAGNHTLASYAYANKNGNLSSMTYGNGTQETYSYNALDQVTEVAYNGTTAYRYTYTNDGNVSTITDVANGTVYHYYYDAGGNVVRFTKSNGSAPLLTVSNWTSTDGLTTGSSVTTGGSTYTTTSTNDSQSGKVLSFKPFYYSSALTYTYNSLSELLTKNSNVFHQSYSYRTVTTSDGSNETTGQISQISYTAHNGNSFAPFQLRYEYDLLGNITVVKDGSNNILAQYTYDAQGQLLSETLPQQNKRYEYTYDSAGNILTTETYTATGNTATHTDTYTYDDSSWNDLLTQFNGQTITYDGGGNPLTYNNGTAWNFTWQQGRKLESATSSGKNLSFTYDADGIRESKTVNGVTHSYVTLDGSVFKETWGSSSLLFSYDENGQPFSVTYTISPDNKATYYYVLNQQGDVIRIVNSLGATKCTYTYDAWGNVIASTGTTSGIGAVNPLRYRGYYYDTELGMYYLQSRYYDPMVKRFINADSVEYLGATDNVLSLNLFAYCENSPVNTRDCSGKKAAKLVSAIICGVLAGLTEFLCQKFSIFLTKSGTLSIGSIVCSAVAGAVGGVLGVSTQRKWVVALGTGVVSAIASFVNSFISSKQNNNKFNVQNALGNACWDFCIAALWAAISGDGIGRSFKVKACTSKGYFLYAGKKYATRSLEMCKPVFREFISSMKWSILSSFNSIGKSVIVTMCQ